jgi:hypothetical protein
MVTVKELKAIAKERGLKNYSKLKKADLMTFTQYESPPNKPKKKRSKAVPSRLSQDKSCDPAKKPSETHVCNPKTGRWIRADSALAKRIARAQMKRVADLGGSQTKEIEELLRLDREFDKLRREHKKN